MKNDGKKEMNKLADKAGQIKLGNKKLNLCKKVEELW